MTRRPLLPRSPSLPRLPFASLLVHRLASAEPSIRMPALGKRLVHDEGVAAMSDWIPSLPGSFP